MIMLGDEEDPSVLTGAAVSMQAVPDFSFQWQALTEAFLTNSADFEADGLYLIVWWEDRAAPEDTGLFLFRHTTRFTTPFDVITDYPRGLLGALCIQTLPGATTRTATTAIRGYMTREHVARPDRVFGAVSETPGHVKKMKADTTMRASTRFLGQTLTALLDAAYYTSPEQ